MIPPRCGRCRALLWPLVLSLSTVRAILARHPLYRLFDSLYDEVKGQWEERLARYIMLVYEVDPLLCPSCGGEMRIIAFIIDHDVVDAILRHLAKAEARSPRCPPTAAAFLAAS